MNRYQRAFKQTFRLLALASIYTCVSVHSLPATAQPINQISTSTPERLYWPSLPANQNGTFSSDGRPRQGQRTAGGSRDSCLEQIIAIVPGKGDIQLAPEDCATESVAFVTQTLEDFPTLWFYLPQLSQSNLSAELVLLDERRQFLHKQVIPLTDFAGIASFRLNYALEPGKQYQWIFSVAINPESPSENPTVQGFIERTELKATRTSQQESVTASRDLVLFQIENQLWHEALATLAQLRHQNPEDTDIAADWGDLLGSIGLSAIADVPLLDCCTASAE